MCGAWKDVLKIEREDRHERQERELEKHKHDDDVTYACMTNETD